LKGEDIFFESFSEPLKKWYSVMAYKPEENQFAIIFNDISDRKNNELEIWKSHKQLRKLAAHLEDVREEERTIIARNIHDELGQLATALKMDVSWLQKQLPKENQLWVAKTQTISDLVDMTSSEIQRICSELRPGALDDLGLEDALIWYVSEYNKRTGTVCKLLIEYDLTLLTKGHSTAIYRMIQEALTNVRRHAKASKVTISIAGENDKLKIKIRDNGIGITQEKIDNSTSFGLIGIEERALSMNGYSRISGSEGKGTTLMIVLGIGK
jgi:signal transduction histidine kinase